MNKKIIKIIVLIMILVSLVEVQSVDVWESVTDTWVFTILSRWSGNIAKLVSPYTGAKSYFNISWEEESPEHIDIVYLESNYSGTATNYTMTLFIASGTVTVLNDSSSSKNLTFSTSENKTIWVRFNKTVDVWDAKLNLTGYKVSCSSCPDDLCPLDQGNNTGNGILDTEYYNFECEAGGVTLTVTGGYELCYNSSDPMSCPTNGDCGSELNFEIDELATYYISAKRTTGGSYTISSYCDTPISAGSTGSGSYPTNVSLDVGGDGDIEWSLPLAEFRGDTAYLEKLNDSSTAKNLTFSTSENKTVYVKIPKYANVTSAKLNLTGVNVGFSANNTYTLGGAVQSSPAVANGYVYVGSLDDKLYQLNATDLSLVNSYTTGDNIKSSVAVANGYVYIGSADNKVYQLNASNVSILVNSYTTGGDVTFSSPAVSNGYVYVGSHDNKIYQLNATNISQLINFYTTGDNILSSPAVAGGYVYVGSYDNKLYQLNASNVSILVNSYTTGGAVRSSPAVANGYVYVGSFDDKIYQLNASNVSILVNSYTTGGDIDASSPAVANGYIYIGSTDNKVYQLNASNVSILVNSYTTGASVESSPVLADGYMFVGSYDKNLYMFNATDLSLISNYTTTGPTLSSPAIANGYVYATHSDKLYQFNLGYKSGSTNWTMFHRFLNNSGYSDNIFDPYPENPYLDAGSDGDTEWSFTGEFNHSNNRTSDFSSEINDYLGDCTADSEGNCEVPLVLHSNEVGMIEISDIDIEYTNITRTVDLYDEIEDYLSTCSDPCDVELVFHSDTPGRIEASDIDMSYKGKVYNYSAVIPIGTWYWKTYGITCPCGECPNTDSDCMLSGGDNSINGVCSQQWLRFKCPGNQAIVSITENSANWDIYCGDDDECGGQGPGECPSTSSYHADYFEIYSMISDSYYWILAYRTGSDGDFIINIDCIA